MNIKKTLLLLLTVVLVFSCKQDELLDQNTGAADLTADLSQYDNSNLGLYKGTFTTLDATERGIVEIKVLNNVPSIATLTLVSGDSYTLRSIAVSAGQDVTNLKFTTIADYAISASFDLSVVSDGTNPRITNVILGSRTSDILIFKETSRGPIATINGTWVCNTNCLANMGTGTQTFNFAGVAGSGALTPQITLNATMFNGTATQSAGTSSGGYTTSMITGTIPIPQTAGTVDVSFTAEHRYSDVAPDCSLVTGTWSYPSPSNPTMPASGTMISDVAGPNCPPPGDLPALAIPIVPGLEGSGCATATHTVDLTLNSGYTDSGAVTICADGARDVWYSWTATTDGLTFTGKNATSTTVPGVSVWDATGTTELGCGDGSFGSISLSGWAINDPVLIRVAAGIVIPFCIEEFSIPGVPANDLCANAEAIVTPLPAMVAGNTASATNSDASRAADVWYTFDGTTEPVGSAITVSLCGSGFDTWLGIYTDCTFATLIASNDDNSAACGSGGNSQLTFANDGATNYVIRVDGFTSGNVGAFALNLSSVPPPPPLTCSDVLVDTGGVAGNYSNSENITYQVDGLGLIPTLNFTVFGTESCCDGMKIYDGPNTGSPEITVANGGAIQSGGRFAGTSLQGDSVTGTSGMLTVVFTSDGSVTGVGYEANVTCASPLTSDTSTSLQQTSATRINVTNFDAQKEAEAERRKMQQ